MITIYANRENGLATQSELTGGSWLNVIDPTPEEIARLQELGIYPDFITYPRPGRAGRMGAGRSRS
jgi:hypothetical protein